jgi:hypothetical protein
MAYGQNAPWGLLPIRNLGSATWNGQTTPYPIQSTYPQNIFRGDPVYVTNGYIHSLNDANGGDPSGQQILGVFWGASFQTSTATNPIDPASPGRMYWPANTVTLNNVDATAFIIDDPNVIYNIQSDATGVAFVNQGKTANVHFTVSGGFVSGNTITGNSSVVLNTTGIGTTSNFNLRIRAFVPVPGNVPPSAGGAIPFNNVEVLIQNHSLVQRAIGS